MIRGDKAIISNEELEWLAKSYQKLRADKIYQNLSKTFKEYCDEFLEEQLLEIKKVKEKKDG